MQNDKNENDQKKEDNKEASIKPAPETLHTTDPQEHMEGPISSLMHKTGGGFDSKKSKEEADEDKEKNM